MKKKINTNYEICTVESGILVDGIAPIIIINSRSI